MNAAFPKHVSEYHEALRTYRQHGATNEGAVRVAFHNLLTEAGRARGFVVLGEQSIPVGGRRRIRVDGEVRDPYNIRIGIWEAKDTGDDLEAEIQNKIAAGYPLKNTLFEDTSRAILYQNGVRRLDSDLSDPVEVQALVERFFGYTEPQINEFHAAVREFKQEIPHLAEALTDLIEDEKKGNKKFVAALAAFHELCQGSLNPQTTMEEVEDMLKQHLLTERIFRSVFQNDEFVLRNPIARELEKVIGALTGRRFSRQHFLGKLDYFYSAIESAARTIEDYSEKQGFLHAVYEQFFQAYSTDTADTHGIVYTPEPIVKWMVASVEKALQREFGLSLSYEGVHILDPCVGTGTFMLELMEQIRPSALARKYAAELHCNEVLLLPYYIATQNIEHEYYERTGEYLPFEGICFADTLEMGRAQLGMFAPENTERIQRQEQAPIRVILGNPPYNVGQENENDNNKNRKYFSKGRKKDTREGVDDRIRATYVASSQATLNAQLYDPYVRFFRWATDRLRDRDGIVCFVSNSSFLLKNSFDGMRKELLKDFTSIHVLDLGGSIKDNPKLSGTTHNVFGIQVGVAITLLVRRRNGQPQTAAADVFYARVDEEWKRRQKYMYLDATSSFEGVTWAHLTPDSRGTWLTEGMAAEFDEFIPVGDKATKGEGSKSIFAEFSNGVKTNNDSYVFDFSGARLKARASRMVDTFNTELDRLRRQGRVRDLDSFPKVDETTLKWIRRTKASLKRGVPLLFDPDRLRNCLYRPFCKKAYFADRAFSEDMYLAQRMFPSVREELENRIIVASDAGHRAPFGTLAAASIPEQHLLAPSDAFQAFPFFLFSEDGSEHRENVTDWAVGEFRSSYGPEVTKWDIFHYVYGVLHSPEYRERYAENLKRELPRVPLVRELAFRRFVAAGRELARLHVEYETAQEHPLRHIEKTPFSWRVERMKLTPDRTELVVNDSLTLAEIPPEVFEYRLGNRSALEWVIDQYRVTKDARSGIVHDPNDPENPEYIVRLVKKVVTVSLETVQIVNSLPSLDLPGAANAEEAPAA